MKTQLVIGNIIPILDDTMESISELHISLSNTGMYTDYISPSVLDRVATDIESIRHARKGFISREDSGTTNELMNCINICHDRLDLVLRRLYTALGKDNVVVDTLKRDLEKLGAVRSKFIFDQRGRDSSTDVIDKDGKPHRRNMHIKLEHNRILNEGRLSELD